MRLGFEPGELQRAHCAPLMDLSRLQHEWGFRPAWESAECIDDFALAVRGRVTVGKRVISLPWRLATIQDLPRSTRRATTASSRIWRAQRG